MMMMGCCSLFVRNSALLLMLVVVANGNSIMTNNDNNKNIVAGGVVPPTGAGRRTQEYYDSLVRIPLLTRQHVEQRRRMEQEEQEDADRRRWKRRQLDDFGGTGASQAFPGPSGGTGAGASSTNSSSSNVTDVDVLPSNTTNTTSLNITDVVGNATDTTNNNTLASSNVTDTTTTNATDTNNTSTTTPATEETASTTNTNPDSDPDVFTDPSGDDDEVGVTPEEEEGDAQQVDALYQGYGEHYVDLWCGAPPQRQTVILNTGAKGTAFPCSKCENNCGNSYHTDRYFQEINSHTFHQLTCDECKLGECSTTNEYPDACTYGMFYVEGSSWDALESRDHCYIGGLHNKPISFDDCPTIGKCDDLDPEHAVSLAFELTFGCQIQITGLFEKQLADGILGMDNSQQSFWKQMYNAGKMKDELFSLCFVRHAVASRNGTESGAMTLGGSDDRLHLHPMVFTKHEETWGTNFGVLIRKIHLREGGGGDSINATNTTLKYVTVDISADVLNENLIIIESGTTDTYFTRNLQVPFQTAWKELMPHLEYTNRALAWSYEQIQTLPTIILQFEGSAELNKEVLDANPDTVINLAGELDPDHPYDVILAIPPNHYMQYDAYFGGYESGFFTEEPLGMSTIGANTMQGHDVLFDITNRKIGWAESHCDYSHLVQQAGFDDEYSGGDSEYTGTGTGPIPSIPSPSSPSMPNYVPTDSSTSNEEQQQVGSTYESQYDEDDEYNNGFCGGFCKFNVVMTFGLLITFFVVRQGRFGRISETARRVPIPGFGRGYTYRQASMLGASLDGISSSELELQESSTTAANGTKNLHQLT